MKIGHVSWSLIIATMAGCGGVSSEDPEGNGADEGQTSEAIYVKPTLETDFNKDGRTDILWYNPGTGVVNAWLLNGTTLIANPNVGVNVPGAQGWQIKGTGDFNNDGRTDILWYNPASGVVNAWLLNGTTLIANPNVGVNVPGAHGWDIVSR
jgi:hypothetical protein